MLRGEGKKHQAFSRPRGLDANSSWSLGGFPAPCTTLSLWPSRPSSTVLGLARGGVAGSPDTFCTPSITGPSGAWPPHKNSLLCPSWEVLGMRQGRPSQIQSPHEVGKEDRCGNSPFSLLPVLTLAVLLQGAGSDLLEALSTCHLLLVSV